MIYRDQLEAVYRLIEKPENWLQKTYDNADWNSGAQGDKWLAKPATCFCLAGAYLQLVEPNRHRHLFDWSLHLRSLADALQFETVTRMFDFNDTHTHAEVLELLRNAIERAPVRA